MKGILFTLRLRCVTLRANGRDTLRLTAGQFTLSPSKGGNDESVAFRSSLK